MIEIIAPAHLSQFTLGQNLLSNLNPEQANQDSSTIQGHYEESRNNSHVRQPPPIFSTTHLSP